MKALIQRVSRASVSSNGSVLGHIQHGLLVLIGIQADDTVDDINYLAQKIVQMRLFSDEAGKMNLSLNEVNGQCLLVSQFTLMASKAKGNRPSFIQAAAPAIAIPIYEQFVERIKTLCLNTVETGRFGADMQVELINDGPVTIIIDSKAKA